MDVHHKFAVLTVTYLRLKLWALLLRSTFTSFDRAREQEMYVGHRGILDMSML